jgi:hypothetical protein
MYLVNRYRKIIKPCLYAVPSFVVWGISLLAFYPGVMTFDSMNEWSQAMSGKYDDLLPVIYALFIRVVTRIWASPAAIAIIQILILGFIAGIWIYLLDELGVPAWLCWVTSILFALSPINLLYPVILWKDILYSAGVLLLTYFLFRMVWVDLNIVSKVSTQIGLGILVAGIALLRYNGIAVALAVFVLSLFLFLKFRGAWVRIILVGIGVYLFFQGLVFSLLQVQHLYPLEMITVQQVAAYVRSGIPLTQNEQEYLSKISPLDSGWQYNCSDNVATFRSKDFGLALIMANRAKFYQIYASMVFRRPDIFIRHSLCSSKIVWSLGNNQEPHEPAVPLFPIEYNSPKFSYLNLHTNSFLPGLRSRIMGLEQRLMDHPLIGIIWRPAIYLYIGIAIFIFLALRWKSILMFFPAIPILVQSISLIFTTPSYAFRFQYAVYLVVMLVWSTIFATKPPKPCLLASQNKELSEAL